MVEHSSLRVPVGVHSCMTRRSCVFKDTMSPVVISMIMGCGILEHRDYSDVERNCCSMGIRTLARFINTFNLILISYIPMAASSDGLFSVVMWNHNLEVVYSEHLLIQ